MTDTFTKDNFIIASGISNGIKAITEIVNVGIIAVSSIQDNDTIKFGEGISFEDLLFERDGNSLIIHVNNDRTQGISIQDYYSSTYYKVEKLEFADGTIVETSTITF